MSPKVLQPANQHDHLVKKQTKQSKPLGGAKEANKPIQHHLDISVQSKHDIELEVQAASNAIEQIEEKSEKEGSVSQSSLSDEVRALRRVSQKSSDSTSKSEKSVKTADVDLEKDKEGNDLEKSIISNSLLEKSISASLSQGVSLKNNRSKLKEHDHNTSSIHTESPILDRSNEAASHDKTPSKSIKDDASKIADSVKSSHKDGSLVFELDHDYRSDTLRSVSENIVSEKSIGEEISQGQSVSVASDSKIDRNVDDIYNDDFFESTASTISLKSKENRATDKESRASEVLEQISSLNDTSGSDKSVTSDSNTPTAGDMGEGVSEALLKYESFSVNDRVLIDGSLKGTIRYIGRTSFSPVAVAGIELDEGVGNNDGKFRDKRYFSCLPDYGLFSPVANIAHLEKKDYLDQKEDQREGKTARRSNSIEESVDTDIEEDLIEESKLSEDIKEERESEPSIKESFTDHSQISEVLSIDQKEDSYSKSKEFSYDEDFEDDEKPASSKELSYNDDFEDISSKEVQSVSQRSLSKIDQSSHGLEETSRGRFLEFAASQDEIESKEPGHKDKFQLTLDDFQSSLKKDLSVASPTTLSEVGSSDTEIVPHPPRLDLDELADSLTERLLKTLMAESVEITKECRRQARVKDSDEVNLASSSHRSYVTDDSRDEKADNDVEEGSADEMSKQIVESASEKWKYLNSAVNGQASNVNFDLEVSEAFISPVVDDVSKPSERELLVPSPFEKDDLLELNKVAKETSSSVKDTFKSDEGHKQISSSISVTESEIENVSRTLMLEAISQMMVVAKEKNVKLSSDKNILSTEKLEYNSLKEKQQVEEKRDSESEDLLGDLPKLSKTPPKSPTELDLDANQSTIDTDLLAAKLSELKRMDEEIDVLLGEDSDDEEEQFSSLHNQSLPSTDQKPDVISPGRVFDFSEPPVHVPNTQIDISNIVADSAQVILASVATGEEYDSIQPDETFLLNDMDSTDGDVEVASKTLFRRMVFDVTRDLMKEVSEFKNFQTAAKQPWTKSNRRVFAKFVRQIHTLTGSELMESFQDHICVCLGLKEGRPSLELLKKRLPLNTSKKDYVDALLVEELREEEPNWVNYDEDEVHVKEQIAEGILETLLSETVDILRDSRLMRVH